MGGTRRTLPPARPALVALLALASATAVRGDAALPRLVLVFDASSSMRDPIGGRSKLDIARTVVRDLLADWDPRVELGLTVYGHRRDDDCGDIERLVPLGPPDPERIVAALEGIEARGRAPLGRSLEMAAEEVRPGAGPATLILLSDGRETCGVDPCAVARELERRGIAFRAHVVDFTAQRSGTDSLRCVADTTGGLYLPAPSARGLRKALREAVGEATASLGPRSPVRLAATLVRGGDPLAEPAYWEIADAFGHVLRRATQPSLSLSLAPGRYRVQVVLDGAAVSRRIEVREGAGASRVLSLEAGRLELRATEGEDASPGGAELDWEVRRVGLGARPLVRRSSLAQPAFTLPAGRYRVTATRGQTRVTRELVLRAGDLRREELGFGNGRLTLRAVLRPGLRPVEGAVRWEVRTAPPPEGRVLFMEQGPSARVSLEGGRYWVGARYGSTTAGEWVDVRSGSTRLHVLDLAAGTVRVTAELPEHDGGARPVAWEVASAAGEVVARSESPEPSFVLPAGRYRVRGTWEGASAEGLVTVRPGEVGSLRVVFPPPAPVEATSD